MSISVPSSPRLTLPRVIDHATAQLDGVPKQHALPQRDADGHMGIRQALVIDPDGVQPAAVQDQIAPVPGLQELKQQIDTLTQSLIVANQAIERLSALVVPQPVTVVAAPAPAAVTANAIDALRFERRMMQLDLNRAQRANRDGSPDVDTYKEGLSQIHSIIQATSQQLLDQVAQAASPATPQSLAQQTSNLALLRHERNMIDLEVKLATQSGLDGWVADGYQDLLGQFATAIADASLKHASQLAAHSGLAGAGAPPPGPILAVTPLDQQGQVTGAVPAPSVIDSVPKQAFMVTRPNEQGAPLLPVVPDSPQMIDDLALKQFEKELGLRLDEEVGQDTKNVEHDKTRLRQRLANIEATFEDSNFRPVSNSVGIENANSVLHKLDQA